MKLPILALTLEVPIYNVQVLKMEFFAFIIIMAFTVFSCLKRVKEIGGFMVLYDTLREPDVQGCERED